MWYQRGGYAAAGSLRLGDAATPQSGAAAWLPAERVPELGPLLTGAPGGPEFGYPELALDLATIADALARPDDPAGVHPARAQEPVRRQAGLRLL